MTSWSQQSLQIRTEGRETRNITPLVSESVVQSRVEAGLCHIFITHTSASLTITENADPRVHDDLEEFLLRVVPDGDPRYKHTSEGEDDMPAHIRSVLTGGSLTVPISNGRLALGIWQGIYLWEHRTSPHDRQVVITICGAQG